jgi:ectoine hydroxylase-related dioxygenase (phytanoyl-CoA dioxygenase family)
MNYHRISLPAMDVPFPALNSQQRLHFDIYGYVVIPEVLTPVECQALIDVLQKLKTDLLAAGEPISFSADSAAKVRGSGVARPDNSNHIFMRDIEQAHPLIASYISHPRLLGMAAEIVGGEIRLVESNALINSRLPDWDETEESTFSFHRGTDVPYGSHTRNGLYHSNFVKTLTNLTDLDSDDGGTVVIAGSHKIDISPDELIACAYEDRSMIHQVNAPAGSTLLFAEPLIHATGQIRSERERVIIINGYGPSHFPYWGDGKWSNEFLESIPDNQKILFHGRQNWNRQVKERPSLLAKADDRTFRLGDWRQRESLPEDS